MKRIVSAGKLVISTVALVVLVLALNGCIRMDMDVKIAKDDTISGVVIVSVSEDLLVKSGQKRSDILASMKKDWKKLPKGAKPEVYDKDGFIGEKITLKDLPAAEFGRALSAAGGVNPTGGDDLLLVKQGGEWKFTGSMDMRADATGTTSAAAKAEVEKLAKGMKVKVKIGFPGRVVKHDKDAKVTGNTVSWEPKLGQNVKMLAVAKAS